MLYNVYYFLLCILLHSYLDLSRLVQFLEHYFLYATEHTGPLMV